MGSATHLLVDTVMVADLNGRTMSGDPEFGAQRAVRCRLEDKNDLVVDPDGNELNSGHVMVTEEPINRRSRIWLPGTDTTDPNAGKRPINTVRAATPAGYNLYETRL